MPLETPKEDTQEEDAANLGAAHALVVLSARHCVQW